MSNTAVAWILEHRDHQGDDCLIWPFCRNRNGRGQLSRDGERHWAHRLMCQEAHGAPPTPKHQAAHSCGKGHKGCVNPRHLSWKTPSENSHDMLVHGTAPKHGRPARRLTWEDVAEIRFLKDSMTQGEIAEMYGVTFQSIGAIVRGEIWRSNPNRSNRHLPQERRAMMAARAFEMRADDVSYDEIAKTLGVCRNTARSLIAEVAREKSAHTEPLT